MCFGQCCVNLTHMNKLHIPRLGEVITLAEPWTFTLHEESRNFSLIKKIDPDHAVRYSGRKTWSVTLPAKSELKIARIYIRNGQSAFDSVTFSCSYNGKTARFWVKLNDANKIVME